ncbi:LVIVD repeat-containing protein [Cesiribacter andamanensis]|uniref:LVIVD repeat protein n=1 Tax=Cesiribacter andamanensis AMV16 TaxID=1279009 RepID=M7N7K6_9BACT|nr:hypothetical protein [Cesiribacter andamanensis]EMR04588.1 hypothetical protein ADICEAN_00190 [Cesiribacter andamanensis AMV16]
MFKKSFYTLLAAALLLNLSSCEDSAATAEVGIGAGIGGSMAQFTVYNGQLYLLQADKLHTYDLQDPATPAKSNSLTVGQDAETVFPYAGKLYIGTQSGMHILSLQNPRQPQYLSTYQHITSCDPVVVEGNYAYLTLRTESECRWGVDQLEILDISNPQNPQLIYQRVMHNPKGLAVNNGILYVSNGDRGLLVLDVSNPYNPVELKEYPDFNGWDVIYTWRSLMMVGSDGLVQYDPADPANLRQVSVIPVQPTL